MSRVLARRVAALSAVVCVVSLGVAVSATGRGRISCDARRGTTLLENGVARVFTFKGKIYACARPYGGVTQVLGPKGPSSAPTRIQLAGGFVAWEQEKLDPQGGEPQALYVLDVKRQSIRTSATATSFVDVNSVGFPELVVNAHGTLVYIKSEITTFNSSPGSAEVIENTAHGDTQLDRQTWAGGRAPVPITSLGLSGSGTVAYWMDNGSPGGAQIS